MATLPDLIEGLSFSPDKSKIVSVEPITGLVDVWKVSNGARLSSSVKPGAISVACSPDNATLAVGAGWYENSTVSLRDYYGAQLHQWATPYFEARSLDFSPNGQLLACGGDFYSLAPPGPYVFRLSDRQLVFSNVNRPHSVAFSPDGTSLAGMNYQDLSVWLTNDWSRVTNASGIPEYATGILFADDSLSLFTLQMTAPSNKLHHWSLPSGSLLAEYSLPTISNPSFAAIRSSGRLATIGQSGRLSIFDYVSGTVVATPGGITNSKCMALSRDGSIFAYLESSAYPSSGPSCVVRNRVNQSVVSDFVVNPSIAADAIDISPDNSTLAVTMYTDTTAVKLFSISDGTLVRTINRSYFGSSTVSFTTDGLYLVAVAPSARQLVRWRVTDSALISINTIGTSPFKDVDIARSGLSTATVDENGLVRFITNGTNFVTARTFQVAGTGTSVALSPNEALIACGEANGTITVWSTQTGSIVAMTNVASSVKELAFSNSNQRLGIATEDARLLSFLVPGGSTTSLVVREVAPPVQKLFFLPGDASVLYQRPDNAIIESATSNMSRATATIID